MNRSNALGKLEWFSSSLSRWFNWVATCGILVMMIVTLVDVVGAKLFRQPLLGAMEIIQITQLVVLAGALAFTQILGKHVRVELITLKLPRRIGASIKGFTSLLGLGLFMLVVWGSFRFTQMLKSTGEVSGTISIPFYPFAFWFALSSILLCLVLLVEFISSIVEVLKR